MIELQKPQHAAAGPGPCPAHHCTRSAANSSVWMMRSMDRRNSSARLRSCGRGQAGGGLQRCAAGWRVAPNKS